MIECPSNIVEIQYPTLFNKPHATDNSGKTPNVTMTSQIVIGEISESLVIAITWTARDDSGNTDECRIIYTYKNEGKAKAYRFAFSVLMPPSHGVTGIKLQCPTTPLIIIPFQNWIFVHISSLLEKNESKRNYKNKKIHLIGLRIFV